MYTRNGSDVDVVDVAVVGLQKNTQIDRVDESMTISF